MFLIKKIAIFLTRKMSRFRKERANDIELNARSVFVSGLAWETDEEILASHMAAAGEFISCSIMRRGKKKSMGCGVVEYHSREAALAAIELMNDSELQGRLLHCREDRRVDDNGKLITLSGTDGEDSKTIGKHNIIY